MTNVDTKPPTEDEKGHAVWELLPTSQGMTIKYDPAIFEAWLQDDQVRITRK